MRAEEKMFLAIGNINAKLINDVLEKEFDADNSAEDAGEQRSGGWYTRVTVAILVLGALIIGAFAVKGLLNENRDIPASDESEIGGSEAMKAAYERFPLLLMGGILYEASGDECEQINSKIGDFYVQGETNSRNLEVFMIEGVDRDHSVAVFFPEEQKYYVYYNKAILP